MLIQKKITVFSLFSYLIVFSLFSTAELCRADLIEAPDKQDDIVARVNGQPIFKNILDLEVNKDLKKYSKFGMKKPAPGFINTLNKQALDRIIDNEVLSQAVQKYEIPDIDQKVEKELETLKAQYRTKESFDQYLKSRQLTEQTLLTSLQNKIHVNAYMEKEGILNFEPSEEEIQSFYEQKKENFKINEQIKVRHILVQVEDGAEQSVQDAALQKINSILKKIQAGHDFGELALKDSDCLRSKQTGGELGFIERGFMPTEFDELAFSIEPNNTSEVFTTQFGYHILQVLEREPAGYVPLEQAGNILKKFLEEKHVGKIRLEHIKKLRKQAKVEMFLD